MSDSDDILKCSYEDGACVAMKRHSRSQEQYGQRCSGVVALDNMIDVKSGSMKLYHKGFVLRGAGVDKAAGKGGVYLNYCPWCGADLLKWLYAYNADFRGDK